MSGWQEQLNSLDQPACEPVRVWVMDENRSGLHSVTRHCRGLRGHRVVKPLLQRFEWEYLYGVMDIVSG